MPFGKGEKMSNSFMDELDKISECKTPGKKIRSKGKGRGLARGNGEGPIGIPFGKKIEENIKKKAACATPGNMIRSGGKGLGLARGNGAGPIGAMGRGVGAGVGRGAGRGRVLTEEMLKKIKLALAAKK